MKWTNEQKTVIDLRGCNILVSAAAGSGKTAVLIERIVSQVTDPVNPVNIDEFVIVTFTRLAAAQMKEKLQAALEKKLEEDPENVHCSVRSCFFLSHRFLQYIVFAATSYRIISTRQGWIQAIVWQMTTS